MGKSHLLGVVAAVAAILTISVATMANSQKAILEINGVVGFVGISQDPANPTSVQSKFKFDGNGELESVAVKTENEMVLGALGIVRNCDGEACNGLSAAFSGASLTSLHDSAAVLKVTDRGFRQYTMPTLVGDIPMVAEVITGDIKGKLKGTAQVPTPDGLLYGKTRLAILGTATYACFSPFLSELGIPHSLPGPLLPCQVGQGQLLPIELDVVDSGKIKIKKQLVAGENGMELAGSKIILEGTLAVSVVSSTDLDLLVRGDVRALAATGNLQIADAVGELLLD